MNQKSNMTNPKLQDNVNILHSNDKEDQRRSDLVDKEPLDIEKKFTELEKKLFWLLMDVSQKVNMKATEIAEVLEVGILEVFDELLPSVELGEILEYDQHNDMFLDALMDYWRGKIDRKEFIEIIKVTPRYIQPLTPEELKEISEANKE